MRGAIKGAMKAGALNAATGAFRSIGDSMTDASDRSNIQSKYNAIVNDKNKIELVNDFSGVCLFWAKVSFYRILAQKTGWSVAEVLGQNWDEANAKLNNLKHIQNQNEKERILIELLSNHPYHYDVLDYAMSHYIDYKLNLGDLAHFYKRISSDTFFFGWLIISQKLYNKQQQ